MSSLRATLIDAGTPDPDPVIEPDPVPTTETYDIDWTGTDGYALTGRFTFDSTAGSEVRSTEVKSLFFDVTQNGALLGRWTLQDNTHSLFSFNFNAATGEFFTGGDLLSDTGQVWNYVGSIDAGQVGFASATIAQAVSPGVGTTFLGRTTNLSSLRATRVTAAGAVPEPAAWLTMIVGFGFVGGGLRSRRFDRFGTTVAV